MRNLIECNNVIPQILIIKNGMDMAAIQAEYASRLSVPVSYITTIAPEKEELTVDQIQDLHKMTRFSTTGPMLITLLGVDKSSIEVQNMLLKTLEELSDRYIFLLFVESVERLASTIRSRCFVRSLVSLEQESKKTIISPADHFAFALNSETSREQAIKKIDDYLKQSLIQSVPFIKHVLKIRSLIMNNNVDPGMGLDSILLFYLKHSTMKDRHETSK